MFLKRNANHFCHSTKSSLGEWKKKYFAFIALNPPSASFSYFQWLRVTKFIFIDYIFDSACITHTIVFFIRLIFHFMFLCVFMFSTSNFYSSLYVVSEESHLKFETLFLLRINNSSKRSQHLKCGMHAMNLMWTLYINQVMYITRTIAEQNWMRKSAKNHLKNVKINTKNRKKIIWKMCTLKIVMNKRPRTHINNSKYLRLIVPFRQISVILSIKLFHIIYLWRWRRLLCANTLLTFT